jgi:hypothetical protein
LIGFKLFFSGKAADGTAKPRFIVVMCANPASGGVYKMTACPGGGRYQGRSSRQAGRRHIFILRREGCRRNDLNNFETAEFGACQDAIQGIHRDFSIIVKLNNTPLESSLLAGV